MQEVGVWLKFIGEELDVRSVPIYELGDSLMAIQRIVNKTFLFNNHRLRKRAQLTDEERRTLALQIGEHRKSSDLYALLPFAADPTLQRYLGELLKIGLGTLGKYALRSVLRDSDKKSPSITAGDLDHSILIGAIYAETVQLTNHIDNVGGIRAIELIPQGFRMPRVHLDQDTQKYVRGIVNESYTGRRTSISGEVKHLSPERLLAQVRVARGWEVRVALSEENFRFVRYSTEPSQRLTFTGHPIIRLGRDPTGFEEFEADGVSLA